jgi:riboflavin synthase
MFTGLVLESGKVAALEPTPSGGRRLSVSAAHPDFASAALGDSIAVNGACLTVISKETDAGRTRLAFEVSPESLDRTGLGQVKVGEGVHLEPSLRVGDKLGGHFVTGHVDGQGDVRRLEPLPGGEYWAFEISFAGPVRKLVEPYLVEKGSIAVDGVSLTVNRVFADYFEITLIPHTLQVTRFGALKPGMKVNLEADVLAKYAARAARFPS